MANDPKKRRKRRKRANNLFEEPVMLFLGKIFDIILINVYWLLSCVPIITIGAATSSMYYVAMKMARNDNIRSFKDYFLGFKNTFKRGLLSMLFVVPLILISYFNVSFIMGNVLDMPIVMRIIFAIPVILVLMFISVLYPLFGFYKDGVGTCVKNAFQIILKHPLAALFAAALNMVPFLMLFFYIELFLECIIIWTFMGFGIIAYVNSLILRKIFIKDLRDGDFPYIETFMRLE